MKCGKRVLSMALSMALISGLLYPVEGVSAAEDSQTVTIEPGDVVEVSVNNGDKSLMSLYKNNYYEGKISLQEGENTYQVFSNGKEVQSATITAEQERDTWVRYDAKENKTTTPGTDSFLYPATWVGNFSNVANDDGERYFMFGDWAPDDGNANLDYIGGGSFKKTFTCEAMDSSETMEYKVAFGGDWNHGAVPDSNKTLTFPAGSSEITLWANAISSETYDSITDAEANKEVKLTISGEEYVMVQVGLNIHMATVLEEAGEYTWQAEDQTGTVKLEKETAVTFLYDSGKQEMINSATDEEAFKEAAAWTSETEEEPANWGTKEDDAYKEEISVDPDDLMQLSVNGGKKTLMSVYSKGMFEGKTSLEKGTNSYEIYLNGKLVRKGSIVAAAEEESWIRYYAFQDKVLTVYDDSAGFKYPATWTGDFSSLGIFNISDWAPDDVNGNLDYIGGGSFKKTFTFDTTTEEKSMEYKIAFGGDWNHGAVPGSNKSLTFPAGSTEITLYANSVTEETFDSISDGTVTVQLSGSKKYERPVGTIEAGISINGDIHKMTQAGRSTYITTVLLDHGEYSWGNTVDGQSGTIKGKVKLDKETAVTFLYDAESNSVLNSAENPDSLKNSLDWINISDSDSYPTYDGDDLGAVYTKESTTFKVWAPSASNVVLKRYAKGSAEESGDKVLGEITMQKGEDGVWEVTVSGDLKNTFYTYLVTVNGNTQETNDVYAKAVGYNGNRAMVVELDDTDPQGWSEDSHVSVDQMTDAVIWEVHVRDYSSDESSGMENKGKYLAFTETGTTLNGEGDLATGIEYLKELGVNYVQLLPAFDYVNDESDENSDSYDWGYSPLNYNVPEGVYSTDPYDGNTRITEFKEMVQALHENGIGVVMDVVFNHVGGGSAKNSWLDKTVPGYYFRTDEWGNYMDSGTACGNETKSEAEMFRKYMIDSVVYWAEEYHIDGFRFDLMGCHDVQTMNDIRDALDKLAGGEKILMYGEPWAAGTTNQAEDVTMVSQANMTKLNPRIGAFNDFIRDSMKGRVFDDSSTGFVQAGNYQEQPADCPVYKDEDTMAALQGNTNEELPDRWAAAPSQVISYVSAHDDLNLYDKLQYSVNNVTEAGSDDYYKRDENLVKMNKMAAAAVLTSQGASFFYAGEEMARSKGGDSNSYNSPLYYENGNELNAINWERMTEFSDLLDYYKGLIELREAYAPFRASDMTTIENMTFSDDDIGNLVAYTISSPEAKWDTVAVLMNSNTEEKTATLKAAEGTELPAVWNCVVNQEAAGTKTLETYKGSEIIVPAQTVLVLTSSDNDNDSGEPDDGNIQKLQKEYQDLSSLDLTLYEKEGADLMREALEFAKEILSQDAPQKKDIEDALKKLENAKKKLILKSQSANSENSGNSANSGDSENNGSGNERNSSEVSETIVKTGDETDIRLPLAGLLLSISIAGIVAVKRKRS